MAGAVPGSHSDGSCPILLRDLHEATRALASHTHAVRTYLHANAASLNKFAELGLPTNEAGIPHDQAAASVEAVKGLLRTLDTYPAKLIFDGDTSSFIVPETEDDVRMAEQS